MIFAAVRKFLIAYNNFPDGVILDGLICSPTNSTVSLQNLNLLLFITIPLAAQILK